MPFARHQAPVAITSDQVGTLDSNNMQVAFFPETGERTVFEDSPGETG